MKNNYFSIIEFENTHSILWDKFNLSSNYGWLWHTSDILKAKSEWENYKNLSFFIIDNSNKANMIEKDFLFTRTQDLEKTFHDAGQFYWGKTNSWLLAKNMIDNNKAYFLPRWRVQDIDDEEDWLRAETIHKISEEKGLT